MNSTPKASAILLALFLSAITVCAGQAPSPRRIEIVASRFSYSPSEITLKKGELVTLALTSTDVTHGLKVKELGIKATIHKGKTTEVAVTPSQEGKFVGKCSHFCGRGHGSMTLTINVTE